MAEWLYEAGIGEARAALVEGGAIVAARIELEGGLRVGAILPARLVEIVVKGREGRVAFDGDHKGEALLSPLPPGITEGAALNVEIVREEIHEAGRVKPPRAAPAASDAPPSAGADLLARITASPHPVRRCRAHEPDHLETAGWSEILDEAMSGEIAFAGGALRMTPTPAMTLFDVDGNPPLAPLALAAARAVGRAIVRHRIGGSIGIDFPTLPGREPRQAVAAALDAVLPQPYERTAMNGFGFLQIVRRRARASLPELLRGDHVAASARAILRIAERTPPGRPRIHRVPRRVLRALEARPDWLAELARRTGGNMTFEAE